MYVFVVGFYASLYKFFDYGILTSVDFVVNQCQNNWWRNLLYINNMGPDGENITVGTKYEYAAYSYSLYLDILSVSLSAWVKHGTWQQTCKCL